MSKNSYWEKRKVQDMFCFMEQSEKRAEELSQLYLKASRYISVESEQIFEKYKTKHGLTDESARVLLNTLQDKTSLDQLKEALRSGKSDKTKAELLALLESPAYQARLERLKQLQNQLDMVMNQVYQQEKAVNTNHYLDLANEAYYRSIFQVQQQTGLAFSFNLIDPKVIDRIIDSQWSGANYSERIWSNTSGLAKDLKEELLFNMITGRTERETAEIIANKFAAGASKARRLVRTESCFVSSQMDMEGYEACGLERYRFLATLDLVTSDICRSLDGKVFLVSEQTPGVNCPPMHPWCRSTTIAIISDGELHYLQRRARDPESGKTKTVPANMTYEKWHKKYVKGHPDAEINENSIKNRARDKKQYSRYRKILGSQIPDNLEDFQRIKYNKDGTFVQLQSAYQNEKRVISFKDKLKKGEVNLTIKAQKQQEHIQGTKKWMQRVRQDLESKGSAPDMFFKETDVSELATKYAGTGKIVFRKGQQYPVEYISAPDKIGKAFDLGSGQYMDTKRFAIRYSSKGIHLHPVKEVE